MVNIPKYLFYFNPNDHSNGFNKQLILSENASHQILDKGDHAFFIAYDYKNEIEKHLQSNNKRFYANPNLISITPESIFIGSEADQYFNSILGNGEPMQLAFKGTSKEQYFQGFEKIMKHIQIGDIYEMNYCIAFHAKGRINPYQIYKDLNAISHAPFSAFVKMDQQYIISSSPERFLKYDNGKLTAQPIKGTSPRFKDPQQDLESAVDLKYRIKDKTENVMVVDVVRHDLSRIAKRNTVQVEELFEVYQFEQVYQMISTISCEPKTQMYLSDYINSTFPMASMTGAPKIRAMELIDQYENFARSMYSGTIGYSVNGVIDSSVLIRSIFYNEATNDVWFAVGSAITAASNSEDEWEELMVKAKALIQVLTL